MFYLCDWLNELRDKLEEHRQSLLKLDDFHITFKDLQLTRQVARDLFRVRVVCNIHIYE